MNKGGISMSLFSGTKRFAYRIGLNNPPMEYVAFVDAFRNYADTEDFTDLIMDNGFTIEKTETKYTPCVEGSDPADFPYELKLTLAPHGLIRFEVEMRGENQGLAMPFYSMTIIADMQSADKAWVINMCKAVHTNYETVFKSFNEDKGGLFDFSKYNY